VFLLHEGTLPNRAALQALNEELVRERGVPPEGLEILRRLPGDTHPRAALRTLVSALGALQDEPGDGSAPLARTARRLTAQMATLVAMIARVRQGRARGAAEGRKLG